MSGDAIVKDPLFRGKDTPEVSGIGNADEDGLHALQRGATQKLLRNGANVSAILRAGSYCSRARIRT